MACSSNHYWREYAALCNGRMTRNVFLQGVDSEGIVKFRDKFRNTDVFASICMYAKAEYSSPFIAQMYFDLDSPGDKEQARADALGLCQFLEERLKVPQDSLLLYFSGSKGFHVEVPVEVFEPSPSPLMLQLYKSLAVKAVDAGILSIDLAVYDNRRIWRLPNSVNGKSGLYKIPLTWQELRDMGMPDILELAKAHRGDDSFASCKLCQATADWYCEAVSAMAERSRTITNLPQRTTEFKQGWRVPQCIKGIEESMIPDGCRHQTYLCVGRYYAYINMHPAEILERLTKLDARNPISDGDAIERIAAWASAHPGFAGCGNAVLSKYCKKEVCFYAAMKGYNKNTHERHTT